MPTIPDRWRFRFDSEAASLRDLPWAEAMRVFSDSASGDLTAETEGECVSLEFNDAHAAVLYMGRDGVVLRPYFLDRPAADQALEPFFCGGCGIRVGDRDEYLARFVSREDGFRLFVAVLADTALPTELPDPSPGQPMLPSFEPPVTKPKVGRSLEWRPLPSGEYNHAEQSQAGEAADGDASPPDQ